MTLTAQKHHLEYVYVDTVGSKDYTAFCGNAFDVTARSDKSQPLVAVPGKCSPVPGI